MVNVSKNRRAQSHFRATPSGKTSFVNSRQIEIVTNIIKKISIILNAKLEYGIFLIDELGNTEKGYHHFFLFFRLSLYHSTT